MIITVTITAADIAAGIKGSSENCPVGLAGRRALKGRRLNGKAELAPVPPIATEFMRRFDNGEPVGPLEFVWTIEE